MGTFVEIVIIIGGTLGILLLLDILYFSIKYRLDYRLSKNKCIACDKEDLFLKDKVCQPCVEEAYEIMYKCAVTLENLENDFREH